MTTIRPKTLFFSFVPVLFFALVLTARAEEMQPESSITFEEVLATSQRGKLTLLQPTQKSILIPTPPYKLTTIVPGAYLLFVEPPPGSETKIEIYDGSILLKSENTPQISFDATVSSNLTVKVQYTLTDFGEVGVTSVPAGIPFVLKGPKDAVYEGITPESFANMPVGDYGVNYFPKGCTEPPGQGESLKDGSKVYFSITMKCDTLEPVRKTDGARKDDVIFYDVDAGAWYADYVKRVSKSGIMSGYKDENGNALGRFAPGNEITLAELAKITHVLANIQAENFSGEPENFSARGTWFANLAASAEKHDWKLFTNRDVNLSRPATRGEVLVTFMQALDVPLLWPRGSVFKDVSRRTPYANAIETAAKLGYVQGKSGNEGKGLPLFGPEEPINRAEMAKLILTIIDEQDETLKNAAPSARGR